MTKDQIKLLRDLGESKDRGGASMSCDRRKADAHALEKLDLIKWHGELFGSTFFYITEKGIKVLAKLN